MRHTSTCRTVRSRNVCPERTSIADLGPSQPIVVPKPPFSFTIACAHKGMWQTAHKPQRFQPTSFCNNSWCIMASSGHGFSDAKSFVVDSDSGITRGLPKFKCRRKNSVERKIHEIYLNYQSIPGRLRSFCSTNCSKMRLNSDKCTGSKMSLLSSDCNSIFSNFAELKP